MPILFTRAELRRFTLPELHTLYAQISAELPNTAPGSAARWALEATLADIHCEITLRYLPRPGF